MEQNRMHITNRTFPSLLRANNSLIEVIGNRRILIENHSGVSAYTREHIRVKTCDGMICITGTDFVLECISKYQLVITGCVHCVNIEMGR